MQVDPKAEAAYGHSPYNSMFNNPISMSDPEGDLPFLAVVGIGAVTGIFGNGLSNVSQGNNFFAGAGKAALWGGIGAAASLGVGSIFGGTGSALNELGRAGAHALSGGIQSHLQGGSFSQGLLSGGMSSIIGTTLSGAGAGTQIFGSGIGGGAGSVMSGGNFFTGFGQGVAVGAFNHALHSGAAAIESCCPGMPGYLPPGKSMSDYSPSAQMAIMNGQAVFDELGNVVGAQVGDSFIDVEHGVPAWKQAIDLFAFGSMRGTKIPTIDLTGGLKGFAKWVKANGKWFKVKLYKGSSAKLPTNTARTGFNPGIPQKPQERWWMPILKFLNPGQPGSH